MPVPALTALLAAGAGGLAFGLTAILFGLIMFYVNRAINRAKLAQVSELPDMSPSIIIYVTWTLSAMWDAFVAMIVSLMNAFYQTYTLVLTFGILILGLVIALPPALIWTEYHPEILQLTANIWEGGVVRLFYEFPILKIINAARILYDVAWAFMRVVTRMTRLLFRSIPLFILKCTGVKFFNIFIYAANFVIDFAKAIGVWIGSPGSILTNELNTTLAFKNLFMIQDPTLSFLNCGCASLDFVWVIAINWTASDGTARLASDIVGGFVNFWIATPLRALVGQSPGTVPGVTGPYYFFPNVDLHFDFLKRIVRDVGDITNYEVKVIISELVGLFDPSVFGNPNSTQSHTLADTDWIGPLVYGTHVFLEIWRYIVHILTLGATFAIQALIFLLSLAWSSGSRVPVGPAIFCDIREWRAFLDPGGPAGLYFKKAGIYGALHDTVNATFKLIGLISPYIPPVIQPIPDAIIDYINMLNCVPWRILFHLIDSEWRMFNPPIPPRTGIPLTYWVPAPALPPAPVTCAANPTNYPGYIIPWIQHYIDDPDGFHLLLIGHGQTIAQGWYDIWNLVSLGAAEFFQSVFLFVLYFYDMLVQTAAFLNVIVFESIVNKAIFFSRWRYGRFLNTIATAGDGIRNLIALLDSLQCADAANNTRPFCSAANIFRDGSKIFRDTGYQFIMLIETIFVPPIVLPNFAAPLDDVDATLIDVLMLVVSIIIPPLRLSPTFTLTESFQNLVKTWPPVVTLIPRLINYIIYRLGLFLAYLPDVYSGITGFGSFMKDVITYFSQQLKITLGDGVLIGLGNFLDSFITPPPATPAFFTPVFQAIVDFLTMVSNLISDFLFTVLRYGLALVAALFALFGSNDGTTFGTRLLNFFTALGQFILHVILAAITDIWAFILGLIRLIIPAPIGDFIADILQLIVGGLCTVIQVIIDAAVGVINFFGGSLSSVNLCCNGCKKRSVQGPQQESPTDQITMRVRDSMIELIKKSAMTQDRLKNKLEHYNRVAAKYLRPSTKRALLDQSPLNSFNGSTILAGADYSYFQPLVYANGSAANWSDIESQPMSIDNAMQFMAELIEWNGTSPCDDLIRGLAKPESPHYKPVSEYTIVEESLIKDCVTRRTLGEIVSVLPYFQFIKPDIFHNNLRFLELGTDGLKAYLIYSEYLSDRNLPREAVLTDTYRTRWSTMGLKTDHLTPEMYPVYMTNWTVVTYFERNNGNIALVDAIIGLSKAFFIASNNTMDFWMNVSADITANATTDVENWLFGFDAFERTLDPNIQKSHIIWRAMLALVNQTVKLGVGIVNATYSTGIIGKSVVAAVEVPRLVRRAYNFYMTRDTNPEWQAALEEHNRTIAPEFIHAKRTLDAGLTHLTSVPSLLKNWAYNRWSTFITTMTTPVTPRAKRNWRIIKHFLAETFDTVSTTTAFTARPHSVTSQTLSMPVRPLGLSTARQGLWQQRAAQVSDYNARLDSMGSRTPRRRVATFATGRSIELWNETTQSVSTLSELEICNSALVPFCLNCTIIDAFLGESVVAVNEMVAYFDPNGPFTESINQFNYFNNYTDPDINITTCYGNGSSIIQWPGKMRVWNNATFFEIFGGSDGAVISLWNFISSKIPSSIATTASLSRTSKNAWENMANALNTALLISPWALGSSSANTNAIRVLNNLDVNGTINISISENRIYDYSMNHNQTDTTYLIFDIFPSTKHFLKILDTIMHLTINFSADFDLTIDPITNTTVIVPVFGSGSGSGVISYIWNNLLFADYTYTCDRRNLTILQGLFLTGLLYLILSILITILVGMVSQGIALGILSLTLLAFPYVFFWITYNYPAQNLFFLPIPLLPPCFADDITQTLICDIITKTPEFLAGLVDGDMTEQNGYSFPFKPTVFSCKYKLLLADGIDWVLIFLQWMYPPSVSFISQLLGGSGSSLFGGLLKNLNIQDRLNKFSNLNFGDMKTFNQYTSCLGVMGLAVTPGLLLSLIVGAIAFSVIVITAVNVILKLVWIFVPLTLLAMTLFEGLMLEFVFVVTAADVAAFRNALYTVPDYSFVNPSNPNEPNTIKSTARSRFKRFTDAIKSRMIRWFDQSGAEFYWRSIVSGGRMNAVELQKLKSNVKRREKEERSKRRTIIDSEHTRQRDNNVNVFGAGPVTSQTLRHRQ